MGTSEYRNQITSATRLKYSVLLEYILNSPTWPSTCATFPFAYQFQPFWSFFCSWYIQALSTSVPSNMLFTLTPHIHLIPINLSGFTLTLTLPYKPFMHSCSPLYAIVILITFVTFTQCLFFHMGLDCVSHLLQYHQQLAQGLIDSRHSTINTT